VGSYSTNGGRRVMRRTDLARLEAKLIRRVYKRSRLLDSDAASRSPTGTAAWRSRVAVAQDRGDSRPLLHSQFREAAVHQRPDLWTEPQVLSRLFLPQQIVQQGQ